MVTYCTRDGSHAIGCVGFFMQLGQCYPRLPSSATYSNTLILDWMSGKAPVVFFLSLFLINLDLAARRRWLRTSLVYNLSPQVNAWVASELTVMG